MQGSETILDYLMSDDWVAELTGNEFQKDSVPLTEKVTKFYMDKHNGQVERKGFGVVILNERGVKDSLAHGIGSVKSAAFAAVPEIIKNGKIVDSRVNWKNRGYDSYVIAAPIKIGNNGYAGFVIVTKKAMSNRFYLHEVLLQKSLRNGFKTSLAGTPLGELIQSLRSDIFSKDTTFSSQSQILE